MNYEKLKAYEIIEERKIDDLNSNSLLLKHKKTGAKVAILENDDNNKVFYIGFRTPPKDSTGVAHITEHSVLCGSKNFPLKDPFVELAKGSLNTFLNAMTYPDKTVYPVASCNDKDFQNLMHVYLDAVFYPNTYKEKKLFLQEGWHYELDEETDELKINGVVYNEMKGAFSSPDDVLSREIFNSLYPDTTYGVESGGDPDFIPDLTYEDFLDFHKKYYHPSNSYIYLYGDGDMAERLEWIDKNYLCSFDKLEVDSFPGEQKAFDAPVYITKEYPITDDEKEDYNTYLSYNCVVDKSLNRELYIAFQIIDYALVEAQGSPLKQALIDHGIGTEINSLYDAGVYQPYYSIVAKNANESDKEDFLKIIKSVLSDVVKNGFDKNALEAGLNSFEFRYRELDFGSLPRGLMIGLQMFDSWLYDDMLPFIHVECNDTFRTLRDKINSSYYEDLVATYLLNNNHKTVVVVKPRKGLTDIKANELKEKLSAYKESLSKEELARIANEAKELKEFQSIEDSKEALRCIPKLTRDDLDKKARPFSNELIDFNGDKILLHDVFTNGIVYLEFFFKITDVPCQYLPYITILKNVLGSVSTKEYSFEQLGYEINKKTGGIMPTAMIASDAYDSEKYDLYFSIKAKCMKDSILDVRELVEEIIFSSNINDEKRLKEIISENRSIKQASFMSSGHSVAVKRANSYISSSGYITEQLGGIDYLRFLDEVDENYDDIKNDLIDTLEKLRKFIFRKDRLLIDITVANDELDDIKKALTGFSDKLYTDEISFAEGKTSISVKNEAFTTSAQVQYVCRVGNFRKDGLDYTGALKVLKTILGYEYLWNEVRVKGGAYGCMSRFSANGMCYFVSYRDPNLRETLDIYEKASSFVADFEADEETMTKFIIGTMSDMDMPLTPSQVGERSLGAYLSNITYDMIQKERDEVLGANQDSIKALSGHIASFINNDVVCVVGNEAKIKENSELFKTIIPLIK